MAQRDSEFRATSTVVGAGDFVPPKKLFFSIRVLFFVARSLYSGSSIFLPHSSVYFFWHSAVYVLFFSWAMMNTLRYLNWRKKANFKQTLWDNRAFFDQYFPVVSHYTPHRQKWGKCYWILHTVREFERTKKDQAATCCTQMKLLDL